MKSIVLISFLLLTMSAYSKNNSNSSNESKEKTWAEKLGFPEGKRVIILHADDAGMCEEANIATEFYLENNYIQSAAVMVPCVNAEAFIEWTKMNPTKDVGVHLTHTSEWKNYRWGPVADPAKIPGLIDPDGMLWHEVPDVVAHASAEEVEIEIRAQIDKVIALGYRPSHIDTHMGTLYGHPSYVKAFLKVAQEYNIPANAIDLSNPDVVAVFREQGYPITDEVIELMNQYKLPKVDFFTSAPNAKTYEEKVANFKLLTKSLQPGITEIIFHPSVYSDFLKSITGSWQQRVWEAKMFADEDLISFFKNEGIVFTDWKDIMKRYEKMNKN